MLLLFSAMHLLASQSGQCFSGVCPSLAVTTDTAPVVPAGLPKRSEAGVGALFPWADKLYVVVWIRGRGRGIGMWIRGVPTAI